MMLAKNVKILSMIEKVQKVEKPEDTPILHQ